MAGKSSAMPALSIFLISLLGFPATYFVNTAQTLHGEVGLLVSGIVSLATICILTYFALSSFKQPKDWLFYVFALSTFSSCVDMIIGLETDGVITGFMTNYLKNGEPYLGTPYGAMICYWDGTVHYLLYIAMLVAVAYGYDFRDIGLYWVGSIGHSMLILVPGAILGHYGARWSFLLNIPYIFIPLISGARFLCQKRQSSARFDPKSSNVAITQRPFDIVLVVLLVVSTAIAFFRGFAVVGGSPNILKQYISHVEPYLEDPVVFPKIQMLVYMYYFVPFYVGAIYALFYPGNSWLRDWCLIFAGASAQAQVPHIISSYHARTPIKYHVPDDACALFWTINLLLLVLPHVLALRCWWSPAFFTSRDDGAGQAADVISGQPSNRRRKVD